jgi:hypothetical protein
MESKGSPVRPVRVVKEPVGAQNQRKLNFVPKDPELLKPKMLWSFDPSTPYPPVQAAPVRPYRWPNGTVSRKGKSRKSKKSRRTRKN